MHENREGPTPSSTPRTSLPTDSTNLVAILAYANASSLDRLADPLGSSAVGSVPSSVGAEGSAGVDGATMGNRAPAERRMMPLGRERMRTPLTSVGEYSQRKAKFAPPEAPSLLL